MPPSVYITTPIYYVNDRPHIGHCYTTLVADVAARMHRLVGREVFFLTGTDEHAEKVVTTAAERGLTAIEWADQNSAAFQQVFRDLQFSFDDFIRTTQTRHKDAVARYLTELLRTGHVAEGEYEGWYDVNEEAYVTETKAKEQNHLASNGKPLVRRKERNFYFKLSGFQGWIEEAIGSGELRIEPEARRNEVLGRLREGLQDVPITRPVTDDPSTQFGIRMPGHPDHRVYVWIDALFNYLSAVDTPDRKHLWPPAIHLMGKEILWFHAVIWPAVLKALAMPLPRLIYAHSHYTRDGKKMSKSLGNFIDLETIHAYTGRFGTDALRWCLLMQGPLHSTDADFSHARFVEVYNAELANTVGNSFSRVANMLDKYFGGVVPDPRGRRVSPVGMDPALQLPDAAGALTRVWLEALDRFDLHAALRAALELVTRVDGYINVTAPFKLAKLVDQDPSKRDDLAAILYDCAETLRVASLLLWPVLVTKMGVIHAGWGVDLAAAPLEELARWGGPFALTPGRPIPKGEPLFMRANPAEPAPTVG